LFLQLLVASVQQIFGGPSRTNKRSMESPQHEDHDEIVESVHFVITNFFPFLGVSWPHTP